MGAFQEITVPTWDDSIGKYFDAPAANWVDGVGLTCDGVAWGGKPALNHDPRGVRASGFNNIYPYFIK